MRIIEDGDACDRPVDDPRIDADDKGHSAIASRRRAGAGRIGSVRIGELAELPGSGATRVPVDLLRDVAFGVGRRPHPRSLRLTEEGLLVFAGDHRSIERVVD